MAISLGQAVVEIIPDTKGFGKDVEDQVRKETSNVGKKAGEEVGQNFSSGIGGALKGIGAAVAAAGITKFATDSIRAAGDLNEQISKTRVVFGSAADSVLTFGENATKSIGASKLEALTAAGTFGNLLRSVGLTSGEAAKMSTSMVQLAGDMASFNNVPVADALQAIQSGLVGETEPLKRFGVNLNEAALKAEAMRLGLDTSGASLNANAKAQAAYSLIMKATALQQGDFERTSGSLANQQRSLSAEIENTKASIGEALLPAMLGVVTAANALLPAVGGVAKAFGQVVGAIGPVVGELGKFAGAVASSEPGQLAIEVTLLAVAGSKIGPAFTAAQGALEGFNTLVAGISPVMLAAAAAAAIAMKVWSDIKGEQAQDAAQVKTLTAAYEAAGDPIISRTKELSELNDVLRQNTSAVATNAAAVTEGLDVAAILGKEATEALAGFGVSVEDVTNALASGDMSGILERINSQTKSFVSDLGGWSGAAVERKRTADDLTDSLKDLDDANSKAQANRQAAADAEIKEAVSLGVVSQAWVDEAFARSAATDQMGRTADVLNQVTKAATEQAAATKAATEEATGHADQLAAARQRVTDATEKEADKVADVAVQYGLSFDNAAKVVEAEQRGKEATEQNTAAKKELADALDEARQAQDNYLFSVGGAQVQVDDVTTSVRDLTKGLIEGADAAGRDSAAFAGNTDAAINNREALQSVYDRAQTVVNGYDQLGYSSEQAAAHQAELAQQMYDAAIQAGATAVEADRLRQGILNIPREHSTRVDVAATGVAQTEAEINHAARDRDSTISVSLRAVGISQDLLTAVQQGRLTYNAEGGIIPARRGGSLAVVGEGGQDEAIIPMGRNFAANLARIVGAGPMAQVAALLSQGASTSTTGANMPAIVVNITGSPPADRTDARRLGRIVGETAAQVLAHRQLTTAMRVG